MANAKHGQKICWNLLMSRNLPCIYIYLEYCHIRQNANGKLYMLGDEIQHLSFHLYDVWGSFDNQNFYKLLTITVLGSADSNRKERVMQPQNRPVDVIPQSVHHNSIQWRIAAKLCETENRISPAALHFLREGPYRARD